ncbi:MAG: hypothetical protein WBE97_10780 [Candidatus Acidiferrales bacterium]
MPAEFRKRLTFAAVAVVLVAALLLPIWRVAFPPLLDYPNHLARAFVLRHLHDPAYKFSSWYSSDWGLYPYLGMDAGMFVLDHIFPIETAGRVFLSLCALLFPAGAWFFLREAHPGEDWIALWAPLAAYNVFFLEGFLNFDLGLAIGMIAFGLWLRWMRLGGAMRWVAALVAVTALYFTHLLAFGIVGITLTIYALLSRRSIRQIAISWLLFIPGALAYLHSSRVGLGSQDISYEHWSDKIAQLGEIMHGYAPRLDWITLAAVPIFFLLAWWRNRAFRWDWPWLGTAAFLFGAFWIIPWAYGQGSDLDIRVLPLLFVIIFAVARIGPRGRLLAALPLLLFAARTVSIARYWVAEQPELAGLAASFNVAPRDAMVLPMVRGDQDPIERPFTHFWAYGVIRRGWFSPYLFDYPGETPMRITYDSYTDDNSSDPSYAGAPDFAAAADDYQYIWAYGTPDFSARLAGIGDRVYSYGSLEVYEVHKVRVQPACGAAAC